MIRTVVAARSATTRDNVARILATEADLSVVAVVSSGAEAVTATVRQKPDIVIIGADIPDRDGVAIIEQIMIDYPTPIVIVTDGSEPHQIDVAMRSLKSGALTILTMPVIDDHRNGHSRSEHFVADVKASAGVKVVRRWRRAPDSVPVRPPVKPASRTVTTKIVGIAASTGGPAALQRVLSGMPSGFHAPVLVVQHITTGFAAGFAHWLQTTCPLRVKIAAQGEEMRPNTVYVAGDGLHLGVANQTKILLSDEPPIGGFKPSGNFLFNSIAKNFGANAVGVILTGMGRDGVEGLSELRRAGGYVIAQDRESSVVFGMPGAAIDAGLAHNVVPLDEMATRLAELV